MATDTEPREPREVIPASTLAPVEHPYIVVNTPLDAELFAAELAEHMTAIRALEMWPENRHIVGDHRIMAAHIVEALAGFLLTSDTFA